MIVYRNFLHSFICVICKVAFTTLPSVVSTLVSSWFPLNGLKAVRQKEKRFVDQIRETTRTLLCYHGIKVL